MALASGRTSWAADNRTGPEGCQICWGLDDVTQRLRRRTWNSIVWCSAECQCLFGPAFPAVFRCFHLEQGYSLLLYFGNMFFSQIYLFLFYKYGCYAYTCLCTTCIQCLWRSEAGIGSFETGVTDTLLACECWQTGPFL